mmetsp:Transcript_11144/g.25292  ORF Transcript_11144/g.25292 Transcript_11144/m.25292 type:complete len:286 (-) Transcript_11144:2296-3153(-)
MTATPPSLATNSPRPVACNSQQVLARTSRLPSGASHHDRCQPPDCLMCSRKSTVNVGANIFSDKSHASTRGPDLTKKTDGLIGDHATDTNSEGTCDTAPLQWIKGTQRTESKSANSPSAYAASNKPGKKGLNAAEHGCASNPLRPPIGMPSASSTSSAKVLPLESSKRDGPSAIEFELCLFVWARPDADTTTNCACCCGWMQRYVESAKCPKFRVGLATEQEPCGANFTVVLPPDASSKTRQKFTKPLESKEKIKLSPSIPSEHRTQQISAKCKPSSEPGIPPSM